ncbi:MAG: hypothetical protein K6F53_07360 [Lachnospiraceae bacterium]|nr:hypothetical protein [Lachnospiraceae bacterium]
MTIAEASRVTVCLDIMAFLMVFGLILLSSRIRKKSGSSPRLFLAVSISIMTAAFGNGLLCAMKDQTFPAAGPIAFFGATLQYASYLMLSYQWLLYADYRLYSSRDHLIRHYRKLLIPVGAFLLLLLINPFTGIMFRLGGAHELIPGVLFYGMTILSLVYFVFFLILMTRAKKSGIRMHFFRAASLLIPVLAALFVSVATAHDVSALGFAVGLIFLYFSMIDEWRFNDPETGLYNKEYLQYLSEPARARRRDIRSVMTFETRKDPLVLSEILKKELPKGAELVRAGEGKFILISDSGEKAPLNLLKSIVLETVEEYGEGEDPFEVRTDIKIRKKGEDAESFLASTVHKKYTIEV